MVHLHFHSSGSEGLNDFFENIGFDCSRRESRSITPLVVVRNLDRTGIAEENEFGFEAYEEFSSC